MTPDLEGVARMALVGMFGVPILLILLALSCAGVQCPVTLEWQGWGTQGGEHDG